MSMKTLLASALVALTLAPAAYAADSNMQDEAIDKYGRPIMDARGNCVLTKWQDQDGLCGKRRISKAERTVYFDFNRSTIRASEKAKLDSLIRALKGSKEVASVDITGFADKIGNSGYNQKLSSKRANAVKSYLSKSGVKTRKMSVKALGESGSVTKCDDSLPREQLIDCLAADRRVEIDLNVVK